jgi:hypothetical protein
MFGSKTKHTPVNPVRVVKDAAGTPAVDLDAIKAAGHVELAKSAGTVGVSLRKRGLSGMRGRVIVVLDHSGSMAGDYRTGVVQTLLARTLAFGLQIDSDAAVEVIPFDYGVWPTSMMRLDNYEQAAKAIWRPQAMGSTNLAAALDRVRDQAGDTPEPIVCVVITDGNPDDRNATTKVVCDLARYPVFLKFLALRSVPYLTELDDLEQTRPGARLLDNVDSKTIADPAGISDTAFAEAMTDEWDSWLIAAQAAGVLTS